MTEIENLVIDLNTKGWDKSGGKSNNVWGQVPIPKELIKIVNKAKARARGIFNKSKKLKKPSIWTAYDPIFYSDNKPLNENDLPTTISATFKSCYTKWGAVVENMAMKIAFALDLPTSYNYIVKFDTNEYPQIVDNYPNPMKKREVQRLGLVSIDILQSNTDTNNPFVEKYIETNSNGKETEITYIDTMRGDKLIPFDDILSEIIGNNRLSGDQNLIENWIKAVDRFIEKELKHLPKERVNKIINNVHSRIARGWLLKEFCGDCDNTSYNGTVVYNKSLGEFRCGPGHDYGDSFNKLLKTKIDKSQTMTLEQINALPENVRKIMLKRLEKEDKETVADIARQYAVTDTSEKNMDYIFNNFPESSKEFFESIDKCIQTGVLDKIVDSYTKLACDGVPVMTKKEAEIFKEYLEERSVWMSELYIKYLQSQGKDIPQPTAESEGFEF